MNDGEMKIGPKLFGHGRQFGWPPQLCVGDLVKHDFIQVDTQTDLALRAISEFFDEESQETLPHGVFAYIEDLPVTAQRYSWTQRKHAALLRVWVATVIQFVDVDIKFSVDSVVIGQSATAKESE